MELSYYLHNFWQDHGDKKVSNDFPLMYGAPWQLLTIVVLFAVFSLRIGPRLMRDKKPFDLRPWMLTYNGFMFGVNGAGVLIALWLTEFGVSSWSCQDRCEGLQVFASRYLGYVYLWVKMFDFAVTVFNILRKREQANLGAQVIHNIYSVFFAYVGLKFYSKGIFWYYAQNDCLIMSVRYAYYVLSSAGSALRFSLWWKKYVVLAHMAHSVFLATNALYVILTPGCAGPLYLKSMVLGYSLVTLGYYLTHRRQLSRSSHGLSKAE